ncbi:MAG: hypothetical protein JW754_05605 [Candidatus Aenigmarchaeota archaeon]|nr:hypothetical protein [Candidatus Aenigmarchaeota archaeon]
MNREKYYRNTLINTLKIFNCLKDHENEGEGFLTISKISKITKLHKWTVSRTLDLYMHPLIEMIIPEGFEDVGLQIKFIRLKNPDITKEQVLRLLKFNKIIKNGD